MYTIYGVQFWWTWIICPWKFMLSAHNAKLDTTKSWDKICEYTRHIFRGKIIVHRERDFCRDTDFVVWDPCSTVILMNSSIIRFYNLWHPHWIKKWVTHPSSISNPRTYRWTLRSGSYKHATQKRAQRTAWFQSGKMHTHFEQHTWFLCRIKNLALQLNGAKLARGVPPTEVQPRQRMSFIHTLVARGGFLRTLAANSLAHGMRYIPQSFKLKRSILVANTPLFSKKVL